MRDFMRGSLAQAGAPVTRTTAMMSDGDDEYLIAVQRVDDRVGKAFYWPCTDAKARRASRPRMIDEELSSRIERGDKPVTVPISLPLEVGSGFDKLSVSL